MYNLKNKKGKQFPLEVKLLEKTLVKYFNGFKTFVEFLFLLFSMLLNAVGWKLVDIKKLLQY